MSYNCLQQQGDLLSVSPDLCKTIERVKYDIGGSGGMCDVVVAVVAAPVCGETDSCLFNGHFAARWPFSLQFQQTSG